MLIIRREQMTAFRANAERRFIERMRAYIAAEHPARHQALGDLGTRRLIEKGIDAAARHGIDTEGATGVLIELMLEFGERFERTPDRAWAERMLGRRDVPGQVRVSAVRERFSASTGGRPLVMVPATSP